MRALFSLVSINETELIVCIYKIAIFFSMTTIPEKNVHFFPLMSYVFMPIGFYLTELNGKLFMLKYENPNILLR